MNEPAKKDFSSVESRRSSASKRRMSAGRRLYYALGLPVLRGILRLLTATYRYQPVVGEAFIEPFIDSDKVCAPCYWHQVHVPCSTQMRAWIRRGFKACFLVSGSPSLKPGSGFSSSWANATDVSKAAIAASGR